MRSRFSLAVVSASLVLICLFVLAFALRATGVWRPQRPMFATSFGRDSERALMPSWRPCEPLVDQRGTWIWADFADNVLAVHLTGITDTNRIGPIIPGVQETRFRIGSYPSDNWITVPRSRDRLILMTPTGDVCTLQLASGAAEAFYKGQLADPKIWEASTNLVERVESILTVEQRGELEHCLASRTPAEP